MTAAFLFIIRKNNRRIFVQLYIEKSHFVIIYKKYFLYCAVSKLNKSVFFDMIKMKAEYAILLGVILFRSEKFEQESDKPCACGLYAAFLPGGGQLHSQRKYNRRRRIRAG